MALPTKVDQKRLIRQCFKSKEFIEDFDSSSDDDDDETKFLKAKEEPEEEEASSSGSGNSGIGMDQVATFFDPHYSA